jgi:uncharacterized SAM-binding protein YcdF (DUF218 family)
VFYYISKIAWFIATPSNLLFGFILLGTVLAVFTPLKKAGMWVTLIFTAVTLVLGVSPIADYTILPLEERFPAFANDDRPIDGIILLGGSVQAGESASRGSIVGNEALERVLETARLAHRYPRARILISGGGGNVLGKGAAEAPIISDFLKSIGINASRILMEVHSRTTSENAEFSHELVKPQEGERWLLVTSAWHMPRAMAVFEKAGFPVIAYPVDFRTGKGIKSLHPHSSVSEGLRRLDVSMKEWIGIVGYYVTGRTDELLPSPHD